MGKARLRKSKVKLFLHSKDLLAPIDLGELDKFTKNSTTTAIKSRPVGFINEGVTVQYGGWDLSFEGGKVDWALAQFYFFQERNLLKGHQPPEFFISETFFHYGSGFNKPIESYIYQNVTLFGFGSDVDNPITERISGHSPKRVISPIDTTIIHKPLNRALLETIFYISREVEM